MTAKRFIFIEDLRILCKLLTENETSVDHFIENPSYFSGNFLFDQPLSSLSEKLSSEAIDRAEVKSSIIDEITGLPKILKLSDILAGGDELNKIYGIESEDIDILHKIKKYIEDTRKFYHSINFIFTSGNYKDTLYSLPPMDKTKLNLDFIKNNYHDDSIRSAFQDLGSIPHEYLFESTCGEYYLSHYIYTHIEPLKRIKAKALKGVLEKDTVDPNEIVNLFSDTVIVHNVDGKYQRVEKIVQTFSH